MLILLPPSEGKTAPVRGAALRPDSLSFPALRQPREQMLHALVSLCTTHGAEAAETLGLGPTQAGEVERNADLREAPTARADRIYSGVLYEALDLTSLDQSARGRAARWLTVTSGLFGLLRPTDRIPAYRLSGSVTLPGVGSVSGYWARHLDPVVTEAAGSGLVVDLRSSTYASFWRPAPARRERVVTLRVLHEVNGTRKVVSHFNKATKGRLVRDLLREGTTPRTTVRFADHLGDLGWKVETGPPGRHGTRLDVVVDEV